MRRKVRNCRKTVIHNHIDYDKLAEAIVRAGEEAKKSDRDAQQKAKVEVVEKRLAALGAKDYSHIENNLWRWICTKANNAQVFIRALFISKKLAKDIPAVDGLIRFITESFLLVARFALYILSISLLVSAFKLWSILPAIYAFIVFVFAQLVRMAQFEVEYIEDRGYLMAISGTVIAIASLVVTALPKT